MPPPSPPPSRHGRPWPRRPGSWMILAGLGLLLGFCAAEGQPVKTNTPAISATNRPPAFQPPPRRPPQLKPGEELFTTNRGVLHLRLQLEPSALESLRRDPRRYVRAQLFDGDIHYRDVAVHLKGAAGSFRHVDDKPALTISLDRFTRNQSFYGLSKIHLNNSVQDPSYMAEYICGVMFRAADVPAPRVAHAVVEMNGRKLGLYVLKEGFTKEFLSLHFRDPSGNLYDGGFVKDITDPLEKDCGNGPDDHSDLKALAAAAQEKDLDRRWERLCRVLDMERFMNYMAIENMTWDWDGYPMNRNNYRIYSDPTSGRMVFLPHGTDQMFSQPEGPLLSPLQGMLALAVMRTGEGRRLYRQQYYEKYQRVYHAADLTNQLWHLEQRIKKTIPKDYAHLARDLAGPAQDLRRRIMERARSIERQLKEPPSATLKFTRNSAPLRTWRRQEDTTPARLEQGPDSQGTNSLLIAADQPLTASWRARVTLPAGQYRFCADVKISSLKPAQASPPVGVGLRASGDPRHPTAYTTHAPQWTTLVCPVEIAAPFEELELICELRQAAGEVRFALDSLRVEKVPPPPKSSPPQTGP
ncbi:MAG: CotH kinase family protein [Verrucomicrobiae bacterium]|nr:CotH kinase family protein [Verrucomicrobiae bacterium]